MRALLYLLVPVAVATGEDAPQEGSHLQAVAEPATVELEPLTENRRYLRLPDLAFDLRIEPHCGGAASVRSVLVSVADTRMRLDADEFMGSAAVQSTLVVPHLQAGILRVDDFCRESDALEYSRLRIDQVFTARLSLRCASEVRESVAYATLPLDIVLECRSAPVPDQAPTEFSPP